MFVRQSIYYFNDIITRINDDAESSPVREYFFAEKLLDYQETSTRLFRKMDSCT